METSCGVHVQFLFCCVMKLLVQFSRASGKCCPNLGAVHLVSSRAGGGGLNGPLRYNKFYLRYVYYEGLKYRWWITI